MIALVTRYNVEISTALLVIAIIGIAVSANLLGIIP